MNTETDELAATYPSVEAAQVFVIPSYQWMLARVEAADSRLHSLVTLVATVTLAIPTIARALNSAIAFRSHWLLIALAIAATAVLDGMITRARGKLSLVDPNAVYEKWLHLSPWEFGRNALHFAGEAFASNKALVKRKADAVTRMTWLFALELVFLFLFVFRG